MKILLSTLAIFVTTFGFATAQELTEKALHIHAGILSRDVTFENKSLKTRVRLNNQTITTPESTEFSVMVSDLAENRKPTGLTADQKNTIKTSGDVGNGTDTLKTEGGNKDKELERKNSITITGANAGEYFDSVTTHVSTPSPGVTRHQIRLRSIRKKRLKDVSINLYYETYDGFPVIRKWIEVTNNSPTWRVIENLTLDDLIYVKEFSQTTPLTPAERGAVSSIIAFSNADKSTGVISASEIPSALRTIANTGKTGYTNTYFEWVIGPSEHFISEPVFLFAWQGETQQTVSATSTPLDRTIEGPFKTFLSKHLDIGNTNSAQSTPVWSTWSNFGAAIDHKSICAMADIASRCGFKMLSLDDGWQKGRLGTEPDTEKFPDFDATCNYIRSKGLSLGLWVSTFRDPDSKDLKALPGARGLPLIKRSSQTQNGFAMSFASQWRQYFTNDMVYLRDRYGAIYFKQDFTNIKLGDFAAAHESRSKRESLLRALRGYLTSSSELHRLAPDVLSLPTHELYWGTPGVPCDIAILKHAQLYHIPPNVYKGLGRGRNKQRFKSYRGKEDPEKMRADLIAGCWSARKHLYAHRALPMHCLEFYGATTLNHGGSLSPQVQDRQICSWLMGAPRVFAGDLDGLTEENIKHYKKRFDLLARLEKDYNIYNHFQYSGVPEPTDDDWHWWGKLNQQSDGAVVVLRGKGGAKSRAVNIPWVDSKKTYTVTRCLIGQEQQTMTGKDLQNGKLILTLPEYGQEIIELKVHH
jgi:hypothetical protein